jgi:hypothetical protein
LSSRHAIARAAKEELAQGAMPVRCYFHLVSEYGTIPDETGVEAADLDIARAEALRAIEEMRAEQGHGVENWAGWRLDVVDASRQILTSIPLGANENDRPPCEACKADR